MTDTAKRAVRTRFAPSPTGSLHIGGLRTALFNWLYARRHGGQFILRIEDTDQKRYDPDALRIVMEALRWAGLEWDEGPDIGGPYGPYVQSERLERYQKWADWLIEHDLAYRAYETPEELAAMREEMKARKQPPGYNRAHRYLSDKERAAFESEGRPSVVRFKMPLEGKSVIHDAVRGVVEFDNEKQQDTVLLKADGFPTYHLAHIVDEHDMEISHVMRAVEWLPSLPLHWQLWQAFGWEPPVYAHLPVLLNPNGKGKMSKRNPPRDAKGNIIPVLVHDYMEAGYLPQAVNNFLANIGWTYGDDVEIFTMEQAIQRFDFDRVNPANSAFPPEKLEWLNGEHLRALPLDELTPMLRQPLEAAGLEVDDARLHQVAPLVQTRIKTLNEVVDLAGFFFHDEFKAPDPADIPQKNMSPEETRAALQAVHDLIESLDTFDHNTLNEQMRPLAKALGLSNSKLFGVLRVAITGQSISTPLFESMEIIGREESLRRIRLAIDEMAELTLKSE